MQAKRILILFCLAGLLLAVKPWAASARENLLVFAAASTTNALGRIGQAFEKRAGTKVVFSFASSSTLAKQISQGAPAAVYVSANVKWMDYLEKVQAILPGSRFDLLRNRLVLIAPVSSPQKEVKLAKGVDIPALLGQGLLALGDPGHVPAGIYAKEALASLGVWDRLAGRVAAAANVRAALALVESGEAPLGVVYATDAAISKKVKVVGVFPAASHPPIVYPAALVKGNLNPTAREFLKFLQGPEAGRVFRQFGFLPDKP